ncbi:hypothetical protein BDN72DRAFT_966370 [Pluteus cervinus]|uniref:Uncharacterized protein n=1 Tax=Pluteus cervinus TaxID=181527 RepID=A0ACD2ZYZ5_9AGAR|nr:hypothetical protein BDN72DRAFT_966370 [Pluteus cervinus]
MAQPIFAPELEELIFSLAAHDDLKLAGKLVLVAKRVRKWVMPHIYNVVIFEITRESLVPHRNLSLEDLEKNGKYVRHLMVRHGAFGLEERFAACVISCPNLRSLALWISSNEVYSPEMVESLLRMELEYLSFDIGEFAGNLARQGRTLSHPFHTVTHLELTGATRIDPHQVKDYFPSLTHLAITSLGDTQISALRDVLKIFGDRLEVLIWYFWEFRTPDVSRSGPRLARTRDYIAEDDPRLVVLWYGADFVRTWHEGVKGGQGIWKIANEAVRARRAEAREVADA